MTLLSRNLQFKMGNLIRLPLRRGVPPPVPPTTEYPDAEHRVIELLRKITISLIKTTSIYRLIIRFCTRIANNEDAAAMLEAVNLVNKAIEDGKTDEECESMLDKLATEHLEQRSIILKKSRRNSN